MTLYRPRYCNLLLLTALGLSFMACAPQRSLTATLQPHSLHGVDLEESMSRRDEVMLAYTLTAFDAANIPVSVVNGAWGVGSMRKGQTLDLVPAARPVTLALPRNGRVVASVILIEVDQYAQASAVLSRIQTIHNLVSLPVGLLVSATEVLTPLKYVTAGLMAAGLGVQLTAYLDTDDVLGQSSTELREASLRRSGQRFFQVPTQITGRHLGSTYRYELMYDLGLKIVKIRPVH